MYYVAGIFETLGWIFREQTVEDYGIDALVELVVDGNPTNRLLALQIKSGPSFLKVASDGRLSFWVSKSTYNYWKNSDLPTILILCDSQKAVAYWHHVTEDTVTVNEGGVTIHISTDQALDQTGNEKLRVIAENRPANYSADAGEFRSVGWENEVVSILPHHTPDGVRQAIYRKPGGPAPEVQIEFDSQSGEQLQNFLDTGVGGGFDGRLVRANFLPTTVVPPGARVRVVLSDRSSDTPIPCRLEWEGDDELTFTRAFTLRATRFGNKEALFENAIIETDRIKLLMDRVTGSSQASFSFGLAGAYVKRALEVMKFSKSAAIGGTMKLIEQNSDLVLSSTRYRNPSSSWSEKEIEDHIDFLTKCVYLQDTLQVPLAVPPEWFTEDDCLSVERAYSIVREGIWNLGHCSLEFSLVPNAAFDLTQLGHKPGHQLAFVNEGCTFEILRQTVELGPVKTVIPRAKLTVLPQSNDANPGDLRIRAESDSSGVVRYFERFSKVDLS